jgi:hypothetical protein
MEAKKLAAQRSDRLTALVCVLAWAASGSAVAADTLLVPSPYPTIQAGIDAAVDGDEVLVADGVYTGEGNRDIDFFGKAITLRSENGAKNCIIDCEGTSQDNHRGFDFHSGETTDSVLEGFTVTNGFQGDGTTQNPGLGGAIRCVDSSPTIRECVISNSWTIGHGSAPRGGGLYAVGSSVNVVECMFVECTGSDVSGAVFGGAVCAGESAVISGSTFLNNSAFGSSVFGGAVYLDGSALLNECMVIGNTGGSAVHATDNANVRDCVMREHTPLGMYSRGGGFNASGNAVIENCIISENSGGHTGTGGGGGSCSDNAGVENCLIIGNSTPGRGGGLYIYAGAPTVINCTIAHNSAAELGGGIVCDPLFTTQPEVAANVVNSIIVDNDAPAGQQIAIATTSASELASMVITHCNVEGGKSEVAINGGGASLNWGPGNIDTDPLFVDADGPDDDPLTYEDNDYRLASGSPCIDAGDNLAVPADSKLDLAGEPRFHDDPCTFDAGNPDGVNAIVDMGAYEFQFTSCDLDSDGDVDADDLAALLAQWGECDVNEPCPADLAPQETGGDGIVGPADLAQLLANWS